MSPLPDLILRNIVRNSSHGTFGQVAVLQEDDGGGGGGGDKGGDADDGDGLFASVISNATSPLRLNASDLLTAANATATDGEDPTFPLGGTVVDDSSDGTGAVCVNRTIAPTPTNLDEIPPKEIIIVILMLSLWIYSILLTKKAWRKILKD